MPPADYSRIYYTGVTKTISNGHNIRAKNLGSEMLVLLIRM